MTTAAADVSTALAELITGEQRPAEVAAAFPGAVYLLVDDPVGVAAVVTSSAIALPNAAVLRGGAIPPSLRRGDIAHVGAGHLAAGDLVVDPAAWWDPVPRLGRVAPRDLAAGVETVAACVPAWPEPQGVAAAALATHSQRLARALAPASGAPHGEPTGTGDEPSSTDDLADVTRRLVGLGAGLTPAGDDLLAATTAALSLLGDAVAAPGAVAAARRLGAAVAPLRPRTTAVSAALLAQAASGAVAAPVAAVLAAMVGPGDPRRSTRALLAAGHTSGHDLAAGLLLGARLVLAHHAAGAEPAPRAG